MIDKSFIVGAAKKIKENTELIVNTGNAIIEESTLPVTQEMAQTAVKESMLMNKALTSSFNSSEELKSKKLLSAALLIARKKNLLPAGMPETFGSVSSASISDEAITKMKTAYQVATGKIDVCVAADKMIDRATARLLAVSDVAVKKGVDIAINKIGAVVATVYPPARPVVAVLKFVQPFITEKAQQLVKKGIQKINTVAKKTVRKVVETLKVGVKIFSKPVIRLLS